MLILEEKELHPVGDSNLYFIDIPKRIVLFDNIYMYNARLTVRDISLYLLSRNYYEL